MAALVEQTLLGSARHAPGAPSGEYTLYGSASHKTARAVKEDDMFSLLWMCIIGLVAGALAKWIMPGKDPGGIIVTMLLGIAGSLVAGFLGRALGLYQPGQGAGLIMSVVGAILLLAIYRFFKGRSATS
jgi:uncharacterized membrane protein YeaQ/YmgE (transglycosylase-associated protein family)